MDLQSLKGELSDYFETRKADPDGRPIEVRFRKGALPDGTAPVSLLQSFIPQAQIRGASPPPERHITEILQGDSSSVHGETFVIAYPDDGYSSPANYPISGVFSLDGQ